MVQKFLEPVLVHVHWPLNDLSSIVLRHVPSSTFHRTRVIGLYVHINEYINIYIYIHVNILIYIQYVYQYTYLLYLIYYILYISMSSTYRELQETMLAFWALQASHVARGWMEISMLSASNGAEQ